MNKNGKTESLREIKTWLATVQRHRGTLREAARRADLAADHHEARAASWRRAWNGLDVAAGFDEMAKDFRDQAEAWRREGDAEDHRIRPEDLNPLLVRDMVEMMDDRRLRWIATTDRGAARAWEESLALSIRRWFRVVRAEADQEWIAYVAREVMADQAQRQRLQDALDR